MKTTLSLCILLFLVAACNNDQNKSLPAPPAIDLVGKVYFTGPLLDSSKVEIDAGCDCCASDIVFMEDSTFIYAAYCLFDDGYSKGTFKVTGNKLVLSFDSRSVNYISEMDFDEATGEEVETEPYTEVRVDKPSSVTFDISELKGKKVITLKYDDGIEYGVESTKTTVDEFLERLRSLGVSEKLFPNA